MRSTTRATGRPDESRLNNVTHTDQRTARVVTGDLDSGFLGHALNEKQIAWDIETSGLRWASDEIGTCQIAAGDDVAVVVLTPGTQPRNLRALLADDQVQKVFHHAPFDLRFMVHHWRVQPANVACTKVASKLLNPELDNREHSLMPTLQRHLGVTISKDQQVSDWTSGHLTPDQLAYAASDVRHLVRLYDHLATELDAVGRAGDLLESNHYLPTRVRLELRGLGDVFAY